MKKNKNAEATSTVAAATQVETGEPNYLQLQFFDPRTQQHYVIGTPISRLDEQRLSRDGSERGLYITHSRGRELVARRSDGSQGWQIVVEPVRGSFDFLVVPFAAKTGIDQIKA